MDEIRIRVTLNDRWGQHYIVSADANICETVIEMIDKCKRFALEYKLGVYNPICAARVDLERCRHEVYGFPSWKQCTKKGVVEIEGYLFCKQHAKMILQKGEYE